MVSDQPNWIYLLGISDMFWIQQFIPDTTGSGDQRSLWSGTPHSVGCTWFSCFQSVWRGSWKTCSETQGTEVPTRDNTMKCCLLPCYSAAKLPVHYAFIYLIKKIDLIALMLCILDLISFKFCPNCGIRYRPGTRLLDIELLDWIVIA